MASYIPDSLRTQIVEADRGCCAYCRTCEANSGIPLTFDHIYPTSRGGKSEFVNLCRACRSCNEAKNDQIAALDPLSGEQVLLFHPRTEQWGDHFAWSNDGTQIAGLTDVGRATVIALKMNNPTIVTARHRWVIAGWHPPSD
ncbi:MAG: HNH endonuclease [Caldilineaceae bacterium]